MQLPLFSFKFISFFSGGFSDYGLDYASDAEDSLLQIPNLLTEVTVSKKKRGRPSKSKYLIKSYKN